MMKPSLPAVVACWLVSLLLAASCAAVAGWSWRGKTEAARLAEQTEAALKQTRTLQARADALSELLTLSRAAQEKNDRTIIHEVSRYAEDVPAENRCLLPGRWRLLHDAAATGEPADAPGLAADAAGAVTDAAALSTVADNYTDCRSHIDQIAGWQTWWRDIGAEFKGGAR